MSEVYAKYNYAAMCLLLDLTFGHKEEKGISSFDSYLEKNGMKEALLSPDPKDDVDALKKLFTVLFDSGHDAEILSPSIRSRDLLLKNYIYGNAGVREYWCIDPERRQVLVYDYSQDPDGISPSQYTFHEKVPIRISDGKCSIDFSVIDQLLNRVFG